MSITILEALKQGGKMIDFDKIINSVGTQVDNNIESSEERQAMLTERLKIDSTSPFKLPQLVRPILAIWSASTFTLSQIYCLYKGLVGGVEVMSANSAIMLGVIGFYFNSRRNEKMNAKKTEAAIKIEEIRVKADIKKERRAARRNR